MVCLITSLPRFRIAFCALLAVLVVGCASWKESATRDPAIERSSGSIGENRKRVNLEVEFVNIAVNADDIDQSASLWQWIDETAIDASTRRTLLANGIRVGFVASEEHFRQRLAKSTIERDVVETFLSHASVASDVARGEKLIPMRLGHRYELALQQPIAGSHVAMVRADGETIGRTLSNPQYFLAITPTQASGIKQVDLHFRPEIQFGEARQKRVSSDMGLRIETRRDRWSIPELDLAVTASERDMLVIAATTPATGLAKQMLMGSDSDNSQEQVVVIVRVAQVPSAVDNL